MTRIRQPVLLFLAAIVGSGWIAGAASDLDRTATRWRPFVEWSLTHPAHEGNPYDVEAVVTFRHPDGETRRTGMFYAGDDTWKFRFTGTRTGMWTFTTSSQEPGLNGQSGTVTIDPNPDSSAHGFLTSFGNKWGWQGTDAAMVPQLVMYDELPDFAGRPEKIDRDIQTFLVEHGFNGFHVGVLARWVDFDQARYDGIASDDPNPDPRTFDALELLITKTHQAGGMVHIWAWGDEQRRMTPVKWGINGRVDRRLQRYIAARLGPLPGWSMGYGFDLDEWVEEEDFRVWHEHMHRHLGWSHFLGGRSGGPNHGTDHSGWQIYGGLDYAGYEHHRPSYEVYVAALDANPNKPVFSEDRFRVRQPSPYPEKDYDETLTRRGLWDSTMAGGVANIWGNLVHPGGAYERPEWIRTWARFFEARFLNELARAGELTDGVCLKTADNTRFIFYKEDAESIAMDLSRVQLERRAIAVDTLREYEEVELGNLSAGRQDWKAPYKSDWAIAVGKFGQ
ncbi:MAG TPA: DUF5060 domain-containing protein [Methylomirabilota bacterium]|nr:DUF5060 domain-containing protein [Methylomirabilota bacterium]